MANDIYQDFKRRAPTQKKRILELLLASGEAGVLNSQLSDISLRYGGLIHAIERDGWDIEKKHVENGLVLYTVHGDKPTKEMDKRTGLEILKEEMDTNGSMDFNDIVSFMSGNGLHIKHKPFGVKRRNVGSVVNG